MKLVTSNRTDLAELRNRLDAIWFCPHGLLYCDQCKKKLDEFMTAISTHIASNYVPKGDVLRQRQDAVRLAFQVHHKQYPDCPPKLLAQKQKGETDE